ncbi:uncharacterized protein LOC144136546 isoform X1 [Amblyomma americanum]
MCHYVRYVKLKVSAYIILFRVSLITKFDALHCSVEPRIVTDIHSGGHRLAEVSEDKNTDEVVSCNLLGDENLIQKILNVIPAEQVTNVSTEEMNQLINACTNLQQMTNESSILGTSGDTLHSLAIFPG